MPSIRITLIKNAQQNVRAATIFRYEESSTNIFNELLQVAKNKIRLKKATRIFLDGGKEMENSEDLVHILKNDCELFISGGENYIGPADDRPTSLNSTVIMLANASYVEPAAVAQLQQTASLPGMKSVFGMPDLHPGDRHPIGATFITENIIYPALIGSDIGCGMALYRTNLSAEKFKSNKVTDKLHGLENGWNGNIDAIMTARGIHRTEFDEITLGTIGGGNHFAEFQQVAEILDPEIFTKLNLSLSSVYLLVHSGSRRYGSSILQSYTAVHKHSGISSTSVEAAEYLSKHQNACEWAKLNREIIAERILEKVGAWEGSEKILDIWHNSVCEKRWQDEESGKEIIGLVHRKGAAPSDQGLIVVPGSRGAHSYLVMPLERQERNGFSIAHGAGRKWPRNYAVSKQGRANKREAISSMQTTALGSTVVCEDIDLLFEEQPDAYKEITDIISDLTINRPIVKVVAILKPLLTYKMRKE